MNNLKLMRIIEGGVISSLEEQGARQFIAGFSGDAKAFRSAKPGIAAAFDDVLRFAQSDKNQIVGLTSKSPNRAVVITNMDDLLHALKVEGGLGKDVLAKFNQGLLKSSKTPIDLIDGITKEVVGSKNFITKYGKLTDSEMRKGLKAAGYSDNAVESFMRNAKKDPNFKKAFVKGAEKRKLKKSQNGKDKNLLPKGNGSNVPPKQKKTLSERGKELLNMITVKKMSWKQLLAWGAGIGVGALALWWYLFDNDVVIPDDTPENEPGDTGEWAPCVKELLDSKEATLVQRPNGEISVFLKPSEHPNGIQFYMNGRVMDTATKKMGTWKCKGGRTFIAEIQKISLIGLLNEQGDATTAKDVNIMINLLDFPVSGGDLTKAGNLLQKYVDNGKGKDFLSLYQQSGLGGGDLTKTLDYIVTTEPQSVQSKNRLKQLNAQILSGKGGQSKPTDGKKGIGDIDIIWDGQKKGNDKTSGGVPGTVRKSKYRDCSGKDTFEFGCRAPKIKEIQTCLGMKRRYQTGNFGPLTKKALEDANYDVSKGITVDIYNKIKEACNKDTDERSRKVSDTSIIPLKTNLTPKEVSVNKDNFKLPNIQPIGQGNRGESIYNGLKNNFNDKTLPYIFSSAGRIKYNGQDLSSETLSQLDDYISTLGYQRIKQIEKEFGVKYVWAKNRENE